MKKNKELWYWFWLLLIALLIILLFFSGCVPDVERSYIETQSDPEWDDIVKDRRNCMEDCMYVNIGDDYNVSIIHFRNALRLCGHICTGD